MKIWRTYIDLVESQDLYKYANIYFKFCKKKLLFFQHKCFVLHIKIKLTRYIKKINFRLSAHFGKLLSPHRSIRAAVSERIRFSPHFPHSYNFRNKQTKNNPHPIDSPEPTYNHARKNSSIQIMHAKGLARCIYGDSVVVDVVVVVLVARAITTKQLLKHFSIWLNEFYARTHTHTVWLYRSSSLFESRAQNSKLKT